MLIDDLEKTKNIITKDVLEKVHEGAAIGCTTAVENLLGQIIREKINAPINSLNQVVEASKKRVEECTKRSIFAKWQGHLIGFAVGLGTSIAVSVFIVTALMPIPRLPITAGVIDMCNYGAIMHYVFNKMTKEERRRLEKMLETTMFKLAAAQERIHKQHPSLSEEEVDSMVREELIKTKNIRAR